MVFHGFWLVSMFFQGSFMVFHYYNEVKNGNMISLRYKSIQICETNPMVFRSCCNICPTQTFPENGRTHNPSPGTHGIPWRNTSTWSWWSLRGEGGCSGTRPGRMGTRNSEGVPHQREAQGNYSWGEDFHHQLRDGDLFQIKQLPSLTSLDDDDIMLWQVLKRPRLGEKKMAATMKNIVFKSVLV